MGKPLGQVKQYNDEHKWEDDIDRKIEFPSGQMVLIRICGDVEVLARHWITTLKSSKHFPVWCPKLDSQTEEYKDDRYCPEHDDFDDKPQKVIIGNAICRAWQERGDANPTGMFMLPHACFKDINNIMTLIKADPADPEQGVDLAVVFDKKASGNQKWSIQRGDRTPLTEKEKGYKLYKLAKLIPNFNEPSVAEYYAKMMKESMARNKLYVIQTERVTSATRNPFSCFKGDINGKPWTEFKDLVDFRAGSEAEESAGSKRASSRDDDGQEEVIDSGSNKVEKPIDDDPPPPKQESAPAKEESSGGSDDDGLKHPDASIGTKSHPKHGTVPECYSAYDGTAKCHKCPARVQCIDDTDDDE